MIQPGPSREPNAERGVTYRVERTDEHGTTVVVADGLAFAKARALFDELSRRGHKQTYTLVPEGKADE